MKAKTRVFDSPHRPGIIEGVYEDFETNAGQNDCRRCGSSEDVNTRNLLCLACEYEDPYDSEVHCETLKKKLGE